MIQTIIPIIFILSIISSNIGAMSYKESVDSSNSMLQLVCHAADQSRCMFYLFQRAAPPYFSSKDEDFFIGMDTYLNKFFKKVENQIAQHQLDIKLPPLPDTPIRNNDAISICGSLIINLYKYNGTKIKARHYEDALSLSHEIILFLEKIKAKTEISNEEQKMILFSLVFLNEILSDIAMSRLATPIIDQLRSNSFPEFETAKLLLKANYYIFCTVFDTGAISSYIDPIFYFHNNRQVLDILLSCYGADELKKIMKKYKTKDPQELYSLIFKLPKNIFVKSGNTLEICC